MTPEDRLRYIQRILAVASTTSALYSFARIADLCPQNWMRTEAQPWVIAEEMVHMATIGRAGFTVARMEAMLSTLESFLPPSGQVKITA